MGRHVEIEWQESEVELKQLYLHEKNPERKIRLHALWLMRQGKTMTEFVCTQFHGEHAGIDIRPTAVSVR